jgi:hypothetical protein
MITDTSFRIYVGKSQPVQDFGSQTDVPEMVVHGAVELVDVLAQVRGHLPHLHRAAAVNDAPCPPLTSHGASIMLP